VGEVGTVRGPWSELICRRFDPMTGRPRVALPEGYPVPAVRVTTTEPQLVEKPLPKAVQRDLRKMAEKAAQMAGQGQGRLPEYLAAVPPDRSARRMFSFSRLTGKLHEQPAVKSESEEEIGALRPATIDPVGMGTLVHAVLAQVEFGRSVDLPSLVDRMAAWHLPEDNQREAEEAQAIVGRFLDSPRAARIAAARQVHRELEFLLAWPREGNGSDGYLLQGYIDCLYQDAEGAWHLVDYKTGPATDDTLARAAEPYEMQMLLYALAIERILGQPPVELVVVFLRANLEYHIRWDEDARRRTVALLGSALAAQAGPEHV